MPTETLPAKMTDTDIDGLWKVYSERMADIELFQRATKDVANSELIRYSEYFKNYPADDQILRASFHNMTFREPRTGQLTVYQHRRVNLDSQHRNILRRKNRQYQWLLAEAYEEFEVYINNLYAYCGYVDRDFWPLCDYGNIALSDLRIKTFPWFVNQSKHKKGTPHSTLARFREKFPSLRVVESKNAFEVDLALALSLIEKLRHIIVHNGGNVVNKRKFIESIAKQAGVYNNGCIDRNVENFINQFVSVRDNEEVVDLLEIQLHSDIPIQTYICRFGQLNNYLMSYGFLLYEVAKGLSSEQQAPPSSPLDTA